MGWPRRRSEVRRRVGEGSGRRRLWRAATRYQRLREAVARGFEACEAAGEKGGTRP